MSHRGAKLNVIHFLIQYLIFHRSGLHITPGDDADAGPFRCDGATTFPLVYPQDRSLVHTSSPPLPSSLTGNVEM